MAFRLVPLLSLLLVAATPLGGVAQEIPLHRQAEEVASWLGGVMSTAAQASQNAEAPDVQMTTCPVKMIDRPGIADEDSIFLYQEQALSRSLNQPYRQRFLQIVPSPYSQSVESRSFRPTHARAWIGFCNQPEAKRIIQPDELGSPVCTVYLRRVGDQYIGSTPPIGCPANVRGAVRITNRIRLYPEGMETWDRGFDAQGTQVWGAMGESYQFRKVQDAASVSN